MKSPRCAGENGSPLRELVLQRFGRRRHDGAPAREQGRYEVGEGLAGTGARLHEQVVTVGGR